MAELLGTIFYVAPEVFERKYDIKCDIWSIGVITHMLLSGRPPFGTFADDDADIYDRIMSGDAVTMDGSDWMFVSEEARDFVSRLLTRDPVARPSAQDAAAHPWLQRLHGPHQVAKEIDVSVLESLRSFASMNVIKRTAYGLIAASMSTCETDNLEAQFKMLDAQNRGTISMNELVEALKEHLGMSDDDAKELFSRLDLDGDGHIDYSEFLAATAQRRLLGQERLFRLAFDRFDTDHSGVISQENLQEVLGHSYMGLRPEDIIHQINQEGDDVIRYEDFLKAMMDLGCEDNSLPGSTERMKNISRAFSIILPGAGSGPRPSPPGSPASRRGLGRPRRGGHGPDAADAERVDEDWGAGLASEPIGSWRAHGSLEADPTPDGALVHHALSDVMTPTSSDGAVQESAKLESHVSTRLPSPVAHADARAPPAAAGPPRREAAGRGRSSRRTRSLSEEQLSRVFWQLRSDREEDQLRSECWHLSDKE
ncbi:unnamed protein product [Prorocentrum cordatum]|uniref:Calmodulin n=1 Tax=Prorocentrum cordatum TaxID=2364126 RepID=A0ABN9U3R6_9DINO|nr:unnamed protein product [Polarella glacialis]